ncbi:hypothetical protein CEXT_503761 [Caerostris extrusa]|uniref:Uncharacterized protein n=1 Tax=Caerostris extrusa TaxID=172846 RepID=A0AAV4WYI4_CAEEX|nr:hypothetical protein CEXT_503761 [Caerostris extrusa]
MWCHVNANFATMFFVKSISRFCPHTTTTLNLPQLSEKGKNSVGICKTLAKHMSSIDCKHNYMNSQHATLPPRHVIFKIRKADAYF